MFDYIGRSIVILYLLSISTIFVIGGSSSSSHESLSNEEEPHESSEQHSIPEVSRIDVDTVAKNDARVRQLMNKVVWIEQGCDRIDYSYYDVWQNAVMDLIKATNELDISGNIKQEALEFISNDPIRSKMSKETELSDSERAQMVSEKIHECLAFEQTEAYQKYIKNLAEIQEIPLKRDSEISDTRNDFIAGKTMRELSSIKRRRKDDCSTSGNPPE